MAKRRQKKQNKSLAGMITLIIAIIAVIVGRFNSDFEIKPTENYDVKTDSSVVKVHIIDVDNASAALVQCGEKGILIDAGEKKTAQQLITYIKKAGVNQLEYVVASHPHADHIGGMAAIINEFKPSKIIMPKLTEKNIPTTRTYEDLLTAISDNKVKAVAAKYNYEFAFGNASFRVLGPVEQDEELNNMSVILRMSYGNTNVLFPGDAENIALSRTLALKPELNSEILIMAHHGSSTSLSKKFLKEVSPSVAVISCGKDNSYGHPHDEVISYLKTNKIKYFRTDTAGNVIFTMTDKGYDVETVY